MNNRRKTIGRWLTVAFVVAILLGPGPGLLLVNKANSRFGLPDLYVWGLLWFVVEVAIVVLAYFFVWTDDTESDSTD